MAINTTLTTTTIHIHIHVYVCRFVCKGTLAFTQFFFSLLIFSYGQWLRVFECMYVSVCTFHVYVYACLSPFTVCRALLDKLMRKFEVSIFVRLFYVCIKVNTCHSHMDMVYMLESVVSPSICLYVCRYGG